MSHRYDFDPNKVSTSFETFPKGRYAVTLREPKTYFKAGDGEDKKAQGGIQFNAQMADGSEFSGKPVVIRANFENDFGRQTAKKIHMAALGFNHKDAEQEKRYNMFCVEEGLDFAVDTNEATGLGEAWYRVRNQTIYIDMDIFTPKDSPTGAQFQQFVNFEPLS